MNFARKIAYNIQYEIQSSLDNGIIADTWPLWVFLILMLIFYVIGKFKGTW